ncbi:MAG: PAS domain-containing protein, partial [Polyangiales bacterium]
MTATKPPPPTKLPRAEGAVVDDVAERDRREGREGAESGRRELLGLFEQSPGFLCFLRGRSHVFELANPAYFQLVGHRDILGLPLREALPEIAGQGYFELLDQVFTSGEPFIGRGLRVMLQREPGAPLSEAYVDLIYQPIRDVAGAVAGILAQGHDVTEARKQEAQREA